MTQEINDYKKYNGWLDERRMNELSKETKEMIQAAVNKLQNNHWKTAAQVDKYFELALTNIALAAKSEGKIEACDYVIHQMKKTK